MKITKDATLQEILSTPGAEEVLRKFQVPCLECPFAAREMEDLKIKDIAKIYGLDLSKILQELNDLKVGDKDNNS